MRQAGLLTWKESGDCRQAVAVTASLNQDANNYLLRRHRLPDPDLRHAPSHHAAICRTCFISSSN